MKFYLLLLSIIFLDAGLPDDSFREKEMNFTRVREAYNDKGKTVFKNLEAHNISRDSIRIYLRAFKTEKVIEIWAKNISDSVFIPIKELPICDISGSVGPKRRYRDLQVPEGFYKISELNPYSKYYLSMQVNYPNASDSIRGVRGRLGNFIFIHGSCISSGCLAITNERIKELFVYCIEALNSGQPEIGITIYPARMTEKNYAGLTSVYNKDRDKISLWADLKVSYDLFNLTRKQPIVNFLPDGTHRVK